MTNKNAYAQSGVDVEAGYEVVERIKKHVARTERAGVMGALGGFGGMFDLSKTGVKEPVLISGTDGVQQHQAITGFEANYHLGQARFLEKLDLADGKRLVGEKLKQAWFEKMREELNR